MKKTVVRHAILSSPSQDDLGAMIVENVNKGREAVNKLYANDDIEESIQFSMGNHGGQLVFGAFVAFYLVEDRFAAVEDPTQYSKLEGADVL